MIGNKRISDFINSLDSGDGEFCERIFNEARQNFVPVIRRETAALLKTMIKIQRPKRILEVGTAVGYSALLMYQNMPENCHITTIENYEKRIPIARRHFKEAGAEDRITLLDGDAGEILSSIDETFDFIFMDAAKGQYLNWLPYVLKILNPGGILFSDNVLQDGDIVESRFAVERRNRTIHSRMREYLYTIKHCDELETAIIPIGDGVALSVRVQTYKENS